MTIVVMAAVSAVVWVVGREVTLAAGDHEAITGRDLVAGWPRMVSEVETLAAAVAIVT